MKALMIKCPNCKSAPLTPLKDSRNPQHNYACPTCGHKIFIPDGVPTTKLKCQRCNVGTLTGLKDIHYPNQNHICLWCHDKSYIRLGWPKPPVILKITTISVRKKDSDSTTSLRVTTPST